MEFILDYIEKVKDKSFEELPFTEVDGIVFSMMSLMDVKNCMPPVDSYSVTLKECIDKQVALHGMKEFGYIISAALTRMLVIAKECARYKDLLICDLSCYIDLEEQTQSTYFSVIMPDKTRIIVCGGTDDTVVGWREDFNMMNNGHVPCLQYSVDYINNVGKKSKKLMVMGHSKGGMEALYACAFCKKSIYKKISVAYSYDGPGYHEDIITDKRFIKAQEKMILIVPNGAVVGRIFLNPVNPIIVPSKYYGVNQHDPLSWQTDGLSFKKAKKFTKESDSMKNKIDSIVNSLTKEEGEEFVYNLFSVIGAGNAYTLTDVGKKPHIALIAYLKLPAKKRSLITSLLLRLVKDKVIAKELLMGVITIPKTK